MRDMLYISCLFAFFLLLAADFPMESAKTCPTPVRHPAFASFVELSPSVHAACLESARTIWQVRSGSRGRPVIGSLDSGIPLLTEFLPPREKVMFADVEITPMPTGPVDVGVYSLLPASESADNAVYSTRPAKTAPEKDQGKDTSVPFSKKDMLSVDQFRKLKEIMQ